MGTLVNFADLAEHRARTDLERGLALANVAATRQSVFRSEAEEIYVRTKALLPHLSGLDQDERMRLEAKLRELGMALELVDG